MVTCLYEWATFTSLKVWILVVEDWVLSHTHTIPENLGPTAIHAVSHLTIRLDVYSTLKTCSALGMIKIDGAGWTNHVNAT